MRGRDGGRSALELCRQQLPQPRRVLGNGVCVLKRGKGERARGDGEAAQLVRRSTNQELVDGFHAFTRGVALPPATIAWLRQLLKAEPGISDALAARL